jgi:hypothetical protein
MGLRLRLIAAALTAVFLSGTAHAWQSQITTGSCGASSQIIALDLGLFKLGGAGVTVTFSSGASATASVQVTGDDVCVGQGYPCPYGVLQSGSAVHWNNHDTMSNLASSANGNIGFPVTGVRLNLSACNGGTVTLSVMENEP